MGFTAGLSQRHLPAFGNNWHRFIFFGSILTLLGLVAIAAAEFTTFLSVIFLGFILFFGGAIIFFDAFTFWWHKWSGFFLHLVIALLYIIAGLFLIKNPVISSITLTYLLGVVYIALGIFRLIFSASLKMPRWGWGFLNGLITFVIGIMIFMSLPSSGLFIIGLFIGIDLVFLGWHYIMAGVAAKQMVKSPKTKR